MAKVTATEFPGKFSAKDYNATAKLLREARQDYDGDGEMDHVCRQVVDDIAVRFARYYKQDNDRFKEQSFFEAVRKPA